MKLLPTRKRVAPPPARPRARHLLEREIRLREQERSLPEVFAFLQHNTDGTIWRCRARYPRDGQVRLERCGERPLFPFAADLQREWTVL